MRNKQRVGLLWIARMTAVLVAAPAMGATWIPSGLEPGDSYHLIFHTDWTAEATGSSSDIATYNAIIDAYGDAIAGSPYGDITWKCVGSTATVDAKDNAPVSGPVYRFDGRLVADNEADLWNPDFNFWPPITPEFFYGTNIWTGTRNDGIKHPTAYLGSSNPMIGYTGNYDGRWVEWGSLSASSSLSLYGMSDLLTVPVPEPATFLLGVGGIVVMARRRNR